MKQTIMHLLNAIPGHGYKIVKLNRNIVKYGYCKMSSNKILNITQIMNLSECIDYNRYKKIYKLLYNGV